MRFILLFLMMTFVLSHIQPDIRSGKVKSKGVNLGGWLVVEHWMTSSSVIWQGVPEYYHGYGEYGLMSYLGHNVGDERFEKHRQEWITEQDIVEMASYGINTVRVSIGFWIAGFDKTGGSDWKVFAPNGLKYLDLLIKNWAVKHNVAVLVQIHAAKGSQNGLDHSAPPVPGQSYWAQYPENVRNTVDLAVFLAERYKQEIAFLGVGLLNEPSGTTDEATLKQYYLTAISEIRATGNDCILTVAPLLYQQDPDHFNDFALKETHVWQEWHKYLIWGYEDMNEDQILNIGIPGVQHQLDIWKGNPLFIGEWSIATTNNAPFASEESFKSFGNKYRDTITSAKGGWTYWTWKTSYDETQDISKRNSWSLRQLLRNGWFTI
ncbi:unnamed protein product [Paramecium primaurelia]|uniref:glucan 1,3-beta-glucosidase n=1 Tax=Paramecium primaurelia TaxID=5886 RepID=A0A8S1NF22_PARPR|nr:unnamed protein product [Paramecium primaurelia]